MILTKHLKRFPFWKVIDKQIDWSSYCVSSTLNSEVLDNHKYHVSIGIDHQIHFNSIEEVDSLIHDLNKLKKMITG